MVDSHNDMRTRTGEKMSNQEMQSLDENLCMLLYDSSILGILEDNR